MVIVLMRILELAYVVFVTALKATGFILWTLFFFELNWKIMYFKEKIYTGTNLENARVGYTKYYLNGIDWINEKEIPESRKEFEEEFDFPLK